MAKLVLISVVIGMVAVPILTARIGSGKRGLQLTLILILVFNLCYLFAVRYIYPRML